MDFEEEMFVGPELHELIKQDGQPMMDGLRFCFYDCRPLGSVARPLEIAAGNKGYRQEVRIYQGGKWYRVQDILKVHGGISDLLYFRYYPKPGDNDFNFTFE
jgi:hypothetical protein